MVLRFFLVGKLIQYIVEDGGYVEVGSSYVEMEVMKMIMILNVQESGWVKYIKCLGVVLEVGCVVVRLEFDDFFKVYLVELFIGEFFVQQILFIFGEKLYQVFYSVLENFINVMSGFCLLEFIFSIKLKEWVQKFMMIF